MKPHSRYSNLLQFELLSQYESSLFHFTTTRQGGVSSGEYGSFNLGEYSGDTLENIGQNRQILANNLNIPTDRIFLPYQTHADKILIVDKAFLSLSSERQKENMHGIDAMITAEKEICIAVTTADCVPVLLFDPVKNVLAAIHAGWRGTVVRIVEKTIQRMQVEFGCSSANMLAGIAPCISQDVFEVGEEVAEIFSQNQFPINKIAFGNPQTGKIHIDLITANKLQLTENGVDLSRIELSDRCTYSETEAFFSARRQGVRSGRMATGGFLK